MDHDLFRAAKDFRGRLRVVRLAEEGDELLEGIGRGRELRVAVIGDHKLGHGLAIPRRVEQLILERGPILRDPPLQVFHDGLHLGLEVTNEEPDEFAATLDGTGGEDGEVDGTVEGEVPGGGREEEGEEEEE